MTLRHAGEIVRAARQAKGMTLADLGRLTGYSASQVSRLERGIVPLTDTVVLRSFASALGLSPRAVGLLPDAGVHAATDHAVTRRHAADTLRGGSHDDEGTDPMRRRTLLTAAGLSIPLSLLQRLDDALAVPPQPDGMAEPAQIAQRLRSARHQFDAAELAALVAALPGLLASAREAAERADNPAGWALVSASYNLATDTLNKIGNKSSARLTADRAMLYADRSQDPVAKAASARALGMMLRTQGRPDLATAVMTNGIDQLATTGHQTTAQASMYLRLLCARAYTYAWAGDRQRALDGIAEAEQAAGRIPAMKPTALPFATLYRVDIHYALGDAGAAVHAARDLRDEMYPTPERRGRLHTDLARAYWRWGRPEQTAAELLAAYRHAPAEVRDRPSIRRIAAEVVERHPCVAGVRQLATAIARPPAMPAAI
ncbi:helix-turn-helix domain-containing protein [Nonomuraea sp. NPDC050227]|uniref:helix-turn-helix domain-containing protein n=1 Tax=Nonomuraea sp. NPDC050227 TaxID=3364360 RepID=UPI0037A489C6